MLLAGDELGRTQQGNNNAYCQDNELSWIDWADDVRSESQRAFTRRLIALRREEPVFRRSAFPTGAPGASGLPDVSWFHRDGRPMADGDWQDGDQRSLGVFLGGDDLPEAEGRRPGSFLVLVNGAPDPVTFTLPPAAFGTTWRVELSTDDAARPGPRTLRSGRRTTLTGRSLVVLRRAIV